MRDGQGVTTFVAFCVRAMSLADEAASPDLQPAREEPHWPEGRRTVGVCGPVLSVLPIRAVAPGLDPVELRLLGWGTGWLGDRRSQREVAYFTNPLAIGGLDAVGRMGKGGGWRGFKDFVETIVALKAGC